MLRRTLIVTTGLATLPGFLTLADSQESQPNLSTETLSDLRGLVEQALSIATTVDSKAAELLNEYVEDGMNKAGLLANLPDNLEEVSSNILAHLVVAERSLTRFLLSVLEASKTSGGQIIVTEEKVRKVHQTCTYWPICYL